MPYDERVVLGLFYDESGMAKFLEQPRVGGDGRQIERRLGRTKAWIDLA